VAEVARNAFVDGFHVGWWVVAGTMLARALVALVFLPARAHEAPAADTAEARAGREPA
jgi:hypothetical protein